MQRFLPATVSPFFLYNNAIKMKPKLAIIGASYLQLPLVLKAKEMGIETHCFAWSEGAVCDGVADFFYPISIREKDIILKKCQDIGIDGIVTIASDLAVVTVNHVATAMGLPGNDCADTDMQTDKYAMRKALAAIDPVSVPAPARQAAAFVPNFLVTSDDGCEVGSILSLPIIVKPTDRSGSRGVTKVVRIADCQAAIGRALAESLSNTVIIEEFVEGAEVSVESISCNGVHYVLQITDKVTTGAPYFVEVEHHQPSALPVDILLKIRLLVPLALDDLHIRNGASHTEIKITPAGELKIIEIGARMGGDFIGSDLVQLSTGYDFLKGVIQVALGQFAAPMASDDRCAGVFFLSQDTSSIAEYISNRQAFPEIVKAEITDPQLHTLKESADRSGYFIYQSDRRFVVPV